MNYHKLLSKQIAKHLPEHLQGHPDTAKFLAVISDAYKAWERDKELAERAFTISEEEYVALNNKLKHEVEIKRLSVEKLKEAVGVIAGMDRQNDSDDLLVITRYLKQEISKRKSAEEVFTSLIANMESGVLLEDESRKIVFANQLFCDLFHIPVSPDALRGLDCTQSAEQNKHFFRNPDLFINGVETLLKQRRLVTGEILALANGGMLQRDYIPIFIDSKYKGHLWSYTDITEKKKSQDALIQSELNNRLIMNAALDAIITIDKAGLITFWNPQAEKVFGWKANEVLGRKLSETIIPAAYRAAHEHGLKHYNKTGIGPALGKPMELPAMRRGGTEFLIELYIIPVKQGNGEFFCSFMRDISERKKNEQELERLSRLASANENGVLFTRPDGKISWANDGFYKLTGFTADEVIGKTPIERCKGPLTDYNTLLEVVAAFAKGVAFNCEIIYYRKDGTWFWGRSTSQPIKNTNGEITEYFGIIEDISAEKAVQRKLREYEQRLKIALTNVGDNYWEHNFRTGKTYFSNPSNNLLGFEVDDATNAAALWWERIHPDDRAMLQHNDDNYKAGLINHHTSEYRMIHKDGTIRWVLDRAVVTELDDDKKPLRVIGTHIDITKQKTLEAELIKAKNAAEDSTRAKEMFLANMSHEIRTPMNAIMGMANQLNKTPLNADQQFYLSTIQSATDNLLIIINDILDLSKIEAGHLTLEKIGFEPRVVIDRAMQVMMHKAEEKGLVFTNSFYDSKVSPVLIGDPYRLNQILLNFISNAIKFTEKGSVDIRCRVMMDEDTRQSVEVTISDTGVGMEQAFVRNLFKKFQQEDESVTRRFGGTGLGMSICKDLVELMEGTIAVSSEKGTGTSFSFAIPFKKGTEADLPVKISGEVNTSILAGKSVLIADDNEMNRLVASTILKHFGATIEEAQNGLEAIDLLRKLSVDIVLMDVQMPVMDGLRATKEIRSTLKSLVPVIALTAFAVKGDSEKFIGAGMNDYLSKPFEENQLLTVVTKWLEKGVQVSSTEKTTAGDTPLFDLSKLEQIAKGNEGFMHKMITLFLDQGPASVSEIKAAYEAGDFEKIAKVAHRMKPTIDNLGILLLKEDIRDMEKHAAVYGRSALLETLVTKLETVIGAVATALKERIK